MKSTLIPILLILLSCSNTRTQKAVDTFLDLGGNKIHYKVDGYGKTIVMVHGGYLDLDMWQLQVDELKSKRKIIRFSDLGHGKTISGGTPIFGYEIIENLTDASSEDQITLIGLSWGAMICVDYVLTYPEKVDILILVSPGLNGWDYFQDTLAAQNYKLRQVAIQNKDTIRAAELFHQNWVVGPSREKSDLESAIYEWSLANIEQNMKNHWEEDWSKLDSIPSDH